MNRQLNELEIRALIAVWGNRVIEMGHAATYDEIRMYAKYILELSEELRGLTEHSSRRYEIVDVGDGSPRQRELQHD